jgi:hypothetical protein
VWLVGAGEYLPGALGRGRSRALVCCSWRVVPPDPAINGAVCSFVRFLVFRSSLNLTQINACGLESSGFVCLLYHLCYIPLRGSISFQASVHDHVHLRNYPRSSILPVFPVLSTGGLLLVV